MTMIWKNRPNGNVGCYYLLLQVAIDAYPSELVE